MVLDVNSFDVLASASYPTFDLANYSRDWEKNSTDPLTPLVNRALTGTYAPGSTFKMVTAIREHWRRALSLPTPKYGTWAATPTTPALLPSAGTTASTASITGSSTSARLSRYHATTFSTTWDGGLASTCW